MKNRFGLIFIASLVPFLIGMVVSDDFGQASWIVRLVSLSVSVLCLYLMMSKLLVSEEVHYGRGRRDVTRRVATRAIFEFPDRKN